MKAISCVAIAAAAAAASVGRAGADPWDPAPPILPEFVPAASSWAPQFPYPYDQTRKNVTDVDINAMREMCQWFNAQYRDLRNQLDKFGFNLLQANNDWTAGMIQAQADNVAMNVERTVAFLTPRTTALTISQDFAGDLYFPIYQGEPFYRLWQELSNVGVGIRARNTAWVYGPSQQRVKRWASQIERSRICDQ
ncbi:hypothetical protein [Mycobacterium sp. C31M]